ncbi:MAG: S8 family serine peptidase, partial [candidate division Zixibacteria bacterium]|nr:S8 family serine peptidase [candidate division Zixibacteria bacterium]
TFSERALRRRAKVGLDHVVFADLPVVTDYIDKTTNLGARLRRISRWLNAASFEIPADQLDEIMALPFVAEIKPIVFYKREPVKAASIRVERPPRQALAPDTLGYGISEDQLTQINVIPVHEKGINGEGVTLAIFDTGFRKSHEAFAQHYAENRVLAEWDFVFNDNNTANEAEDWDSQWNHGTYIWSVSGGYMDGIIYGPAYQANFILCKTEDIRSETQVEEDNWVAALEWVDSLGADVVTSSLGYSSWDDGTGYVFEDMDGLTAVTSAAASMAAGMGIVVCNSAGNSGPNPSTLTAPADAFDILTCGAVNSSGSLASFSSRGPTYDGRIKPEVVARGIYTACATASSDNSYGTASGTSLSTPLIAGAACLMTQARPNFTPEMIRMAMMETADNATSPDNNYGWGLIDADAALGWGANFYADITTGNAPATIQFYDSSTLSPTSWAWSFGDGDSAFAQNPTHYYANAGAYDVSLTVDTYLGSITSTKQAFIKLLADTITFVSTSGWAGQQVMMSINLTNSQELERMTIPFQFEDEPDLTFDSAQLGNRTNYFERFQVVGYDPGNNRYAYSLVADDGGGQPPLQPDTGEIMKLYFTVNPLATAGQTNMVDSADGPATLELVSEYFTYEPVINSGFVTIIELMRGDVNADEKIDIADLIYLINYMFDFGPSPIPLMSGDINGDIFINMTDLIYLVDFMFNNGPPPSAK